MSEAGAESAPGPDPTRAVVVGPGRVGLTLAQGLHGAGLYRSLQVVGREEEPPAFLSTHSGISYQASAGWRPVAIPGPLELFLAVPDRCLAEVAGHWADRLRRREASPAYAFHTSGAHPSRVLAPLAGAGARVGVLHPLRAVSAPETGGLSGAWFGVEGSEEAAARARTLAAALGGHALRVRVGASARYHAAAVMASNLLVGCLALARRELREATDATDEELTEALRELSASAIRAAGRGGEAPGLTGPLARGDLETIGRHLQALDSEAGEAYSALTRALARRVLGLEGDGLAAVERLLDRGSVSPDTASGEAALPGEDAASGADGADERHDAGE